MTEGVETRRIKRGTGVEDAFPLRKTPAFAAAGLRLAGRFSVN
jgi:hypothetical protein